MQSLQAFDSRQQHIAGSATAGQGRLGGLSAKQVRSQWPQAGRQGRQRSLMADRGKPTHPAMQLEHAALTGKLLARRTFFRSRLSAFSPCCGCCSIRPFSSRAQASALILFVSCWRVPSQRLPSLRGLPFWENASSQKVLKRSQLDQTSPSPQLLTSASQTLPQALTLHTGLPVPSVSSWGSHPNPKF